MILREQLELVVQKKKIDDVHNWFRYHFVDCSKDQYVAKCPYLIIQGPPGCGKTSTLKYVAHRIGVPIVEFSETSDNGIEYIRDEVYQSAAFRDSENRSADRRRATIFEKFVEQKARMVPLPISKPIAPCADSEFDTDSDDDLPVSIFSRPKPKPVDQKPSGVIIFVETPLLFARSHRTLTSTLTSIRKNLQGMAALGPRRTAIVFEIIDGDRDIISLPNKYKQSIGLEVIKFNPVIRTNMRKFIEFKLRNYQTIGLDRGAIDALIEDCDGDLSACLNSLEIMSTRVNSHSNPIAGIQNDILSPLNDQQVHKRQRLCPDRFKLNANLMRDVTRSCGFFHLLGKVFYQKRLYPDGQESRRRKYRSIERPYGPENSVEYLSSRLSIEPKILLTWLHQHYPKFCGEKNIGKAAAFLEYLSETDTISINSLNSTQFYELHYILDQQQINLALEFTRFTLYEDQSAQIKSSHKKIHKDRETFIVKPSVESVSKNGFGELYSFSRPECLNMCKVVDDRQIILKYLSDTVFIDQIRCTDQNLMVVDYLPYLSIMSNNWKNRMNHSLSDGYVDCTPSLIKNNDTQKLIQVLENLEFTSKEFATQHEELSAIIEKIDEETNIKTRGDNHNTNQSMAH